MKMVYPLWLKIWLGILGVPVLLGFFPFILMYFKMKGEWARDLDFWRKNRFANYLIPMPEGGYSEETWIAIRPQPLLFLLVGISYFLFYGFLLADSYWALILGLIVLPLVLFGCYLFDFGMDAEWSRGQTRFGLVIQEVLVTAAVICPLIYLIDLLLERLPI